MSLVIITELSCDDRHCGATRRYAARIFLFPSFYDMEKVQILLYHHRNYANLEGVISSLLVFCILQHNNVQQLKVKKVQTY